MGLYEASPVFDLTVGNAERGSFYKRVPKDKYPPNYFDSIGK